MTNIKDSLNKINKFSFEDHIEWLDNKIKQNNESKLFYFCYINQFLEKYNSKLSQKKYIYLEKLYEISIDLKLIKFSSSILSSFKSYFGSNNEKIKHLDANLMEISNKDLNIALSIYSNLFKNNQYSQRDLKDYIYLKKLDFSYCDLRGYIDILNEYLKVYCDDVEIWEELAEIYISTLNYQKAIFCLEEIILFTPHDYLLYLRIGELLNSLNSVESSLQALDYYSKSILIRPTLKAFWGIIYIENIFKKFSKPLTDNLRTCINIAKKQLEIIYKKNGNEYIVSNIINNQ